MQRGSVRKGGLVLRQERTVATADRAPATEVGTVIIIHLQWNYHPSWSDSVYKKLHSPPHPPTLHRPFSLHCHMPNALPNSGCISIVACCWMESPSAQHQLPALFKVALLRTFDLGQAAYIWIEITHFEWSEERPLISAFICVLSLFTVGLILFSLPTFLPIQTNKQSLKSHLAVKSPTKSLWRPLVARPSALFPRQAELSFRAFV